jgi:hypothetical protein
MEYFRDFVPQITPLPNPDPYKRAQNQLNVGDVLFSATRAFQLILQSDGNLVLYCISNPPLDITQATYTNALWSSETNGTDAKRVNMQDDGNLVVYGADGTALWNSQTSGNEGAFCRCQDDGNLVVYAYDIPTATVGAALWSSKTYAGPR